MPPWEWGSVGAVVEAAELPWTVRKIPWKYNVNFRGK